MNVNMASLEASMKRGQRGLGTSAKQMPADPPLVNTCSHVFYHIFLSLLNFINNYSCFSVGGFAKVKLAVHNLTGEKVLITY